MAASGRRRNGRQAACDGPKPEAVASAQRRRCLVDGAKPLANASHGRFGEVTALQAAVASVRRVTSGEGSASAARADVVKKEAGPEAVGPINRTQTLALGLSPTVEDTAAQPIQSPRRGRPAASRSQRSGLVWCFPLRWEGRKEGEDARRGDWPTQGERERECRASAPQISSCRPPAVILFLCSQAARACSDGFISPFS